MRPTLLLLSLILLAGCEIAPQEERIVEASQPTMAEAQEELVLTDSVSSAKHLSQLSNKIDDSAPSVPKFDVPTPSLTDGLPVEQRAPFTVRK